jgi:hypothetical protein
MNGAVGNAVVGLPALIGVVLGLKLYAEGSPTCIGVALLLVVPAILLAIAFAIVARLPRIARVLIELWVLSAVAVTAFATAAITWLTLNGKALNYIVNTASLPTATATTMSAALITAITTYVALAWTKDIGDAKGFFWPSTQFKRAMAKAYALLPDARKPAGNTAAFDALFADTVQGYGNIGWGFGARGTRAKILSGII